MKLQTLGIFWLLMLVMVVTMYVSMFTLMETKVPVTEITQSQMNKLTEQIGMMGLERMKDNQCDRVVYHYINSGEWLDQWCADHYRHLRF